MHRYVLLVGLALLTGSAAAEEATLPCGGPREAAYSIRFAPAPAAPGEVAGYRLYRTQQGGTEEAVELTSTLAGSDGLTRASLGFDAARAYMVTLTAYGPGGESPRSNALAIAAISAGACARPGAVRLIEIVIEVDGERITLPPVRSEEQP